LGTRKDLSLPTTANHEAHASKWTEKSLQFLTTFPRGVYRTMMLLPRIWQQKVTASVAGRERGDLREACLTGCRKTDCSVSDSTLIITSAFDDTIDSLSAAQEERTSRTIVPANICMQSRTRNYPRQGLSLCAINRVSDLEILVLSVCPSATKRS
jgi:hypothetical protein